MSTVTVDHHSHSEHPAYDATFFATQTLGKAVNSYQSAVITGVLGMAMALTLGLCAGDGMRTFWSSYLLAMAYFCSISLGGLAFVGLHYLTRAGWGIVVRRLAEIYAANITICAILFIPIVLLVLVGSNALYIWNDAELARTDHLIQIKTPFLNAGFFTLRQFIYFGAWIYITRRFYTQSLQQDKVGGTEITLKLENFSAPVMLVFALTVTFASIDWLMSLDPHWFSTIFGVYYFSGCMVSFLATANLTIYVLQKRLHLLPMINAEHRHDLGKLMFGFTCFWAYAGFSQYLLIWYANIPEETVWFQARQNHGWQFVSVLLMTGHFILPFLGLMRRKIKRNQDLLAIWSVIMLCMHAVDIYWLIFPTFESTGPTLPLTSISCLLGVGGFYFASWLLKAGQNPLVPVNDPRMHESLATYNP